MSPHSVSHQISDKNQDYDDKFISKNEEKFNINQRSNENMFFNQMNINSLKEITNQKIKERSETRHL